MHYRCHNSEDWKLQPLTAGPTATGRRRGTAAIAAPQESPALPASFLRDGVSIEATLEAASGPVRRGATVPALDLEVPCARGERAVIAVRHPSGALTFHAAIEHTQVRRSRSTAGAGGEATARFRIPVRADVAATDGEPARRGVISKLIKVVVLKVKEKLLDAAIRQAVEFAALGAETLWWKARGLQEGWFEVDVASLRAGKLHPAQPGGLTGGDRALLLLHGTFSHAVGAFRDLAGTPGGFFDAVAPRYGSRVFAFNHFSLSRTPEENARMLLERLPDRAVPFDVITHSRGGLVLRQLVERRDAFGTLARRFALGHAVLVASPNAGTPLATLDRWEETVGFVANLLELFPDNPWTTAAEFVANGIVTIAGHVTQDLPGLAAMDARGEPIAELQAPPGPQPDAYSALVANYNPGAALWQRLLDAGMDGFFAGANDLVVPTEGGWLVDGPHGPAIPAERIGCFGPGGNLRATAESPVTHLNFFAQKETVEFLRRALLREGQRCLPLEPAIALPTRRLWRGGRPVQARLPAVVPPVERPARPAELEAAPLAPTVRARAWAQASELSSSGPGAGRGDVFHLMILHGRQGHKDAQVLAMYGSARVLEPFETSNVKAVPGEVGAASGMDGAGTRFNRIIRTHSLIRQCLEGRADKQGRMPTLPKEGQLREFGELLFEALLSGNVRRLYDVARSEPRDGPLNVILTCTIPWLAEKPWEFAFDPSRRKFLVTEEIHFVRNVLTAVPAQRAAPGRGGLRMLVVAAQPVGTVELAEADEAAVIRHGFQALLDAGLAQVDVLTRATPAALHEQVQTRTYDVVHFIGHGDFDTHAHEGVLLFESADGGLHEVDARTLREILCNRGIQLVFLNACESGRDATEERNRGVAQALMEAGLPAVVANQYKVLDPSAVAFAGHFYWSLAQGATLGEAGREARIAVNYSLSGEVIDWAVPMVYARDPDFRLAPQVARRLAMPSAGTTRRGAAKAVPPGASRGGAASPAGRARAAGGPSAAAPAPVRVAFADLAHAFPDLDATLARLTAAQTRFEFTAVDVVAPLGTWYVHQFPEEDAPVSYLYADRFARRLAKKPTELGVDFLVCVTNWPMVCDAGEEMMFNIYGWWDETRKLPVILLSNAGLPLAPRGVETERAIANALVTTLAGIFGRLDTHERGPEDCPLYLNPDRDMNHIQGRQRFDEQCLKHLAKTAPHELPALNALLGVFHDDAR